MQNIRTKHREDIWLKFLKQKVDLHKEKEALISQVENYKK